MGMKLKPSKCRSFSIQSGKPSIITFQVGNDNIPSIYHEDQKFLGKLLFFNGKSKDTFDHIKSEIETRLQRLEETEIRNEYKLWIYKHYTLPSIRFLLSVHDITKTDLSKLDSLCNKHVKKWTGLPPCATNTIFHLKHALDIPSVTSVYEEAHIVTHVDARLKSDDLVKHALDSRIEREAQFTRKQSVTVLAENTFQKSLRWNTVQAEIPEFVSPVTFRTEVKETAKSLARTTHHTMHASHLNDLSKQGPLLNLSIREVQDMTWKSFAFNLKKVVLKFILNATLDTLPTRANLLQWKKSSSDKCVLCNGRQTTVHVLSACPVALNQGRLTWRHDGIVNYIAKSVDTSKFSIYADVPEYNTPAGGTIPPSLTVTSDKPDIVIIDEKTKAVAIFEFTVPFEHNTETRNTSKNAKYEHLKEEISNYKTQIVAFEIGARGYISRENRNRLKKIHKYCKKEIKLKDFEENIARLSINASYYIYLCRDQTEWATPSLLSP